MSNTKIEGQGSLPHREPVILVGLTADEEEATRRAIEETVHFQVGGAYHTYKEALHLLESVCVRFVILSTRLSDMSLTAFLKQANSHFDVHAAELIPEGVADKAVCMLAIDGLNSRRVVNFMRAPVTSSQIDQIYQDLILHRRCISSAHVSVVPAISAAG